MKHQKRNWLDIPSDVMENILNRIGIIDILENAQKVCTVWRKICKSPVLWRVINMNDILQLTSNISTIKLICKQAMDRSQGQLVDITLIHDYNAELFLYAAERSSQLRRLEITSCIVYGGLTTEAMMKFPLLEELNLYSVEISKEEIETVGRYCPMLKTLKVNGKVPLCSLDFPADEASNEIAIAIGQNLVGLRHLQLIGNKMTIFGLQVILDNCCHLEKLDLLACLYIDITGVLGKKCFEQIKHLKLPHDSLDGCLDYFKIVRETYYDDEDVPYVDTDFLLVDYVYISE
ncbi:hypothetical protein R6Q59_008823 [Mikania micrantha]